VNLYKWYVPFATGHAYIATPLAAAEAIAVNLACDWSTPGSHCLDAAASVRFTLPGWSNRSICLCVSVCPSNRLYCSPALKVKENLILRI